MTYRRRNPASISLYAPHGLLGIPEWLNLHKAPLQHPPSEGAGMPAQMINPPLPPFPQWVKRLRAIRGDKAVNQQHRGWPPI